MKGVRAAALFAALLVSGPVALSQQPSYSGHGAGSVTPELVAKYAAPPLEPPVTRDIQSMLDVRAPGLGLVAPDGSQALLRLAHHRDRRRCSGSTQPKGFPVQMTGGEERTTRQGVTPDGKWLVVSRDVRAARRIRGSTSRRPTAAR